MLIEQLSPLTAARLKVIDIEATLQTAALSLSSPGIELVIVSNGEDRKMAGVLGKSDLIRYLAYQDPAKASVAALMSREVISCNPSDELHATWQRMVAWSLQNIPILDAHSVPLGILNVRDAGRALYRQEQYQEHMLTDYIAGVGYH